MANVVCLSLTRDAIVHARVDDVFSDSGLTLDVEVPETEAQIRLALEQHAPAFLLIGAQFQGDLSPLVRGRFVLDGPPVVVVTLRDTTEELLEAARLVGAAWVIGPAEAPPEIVAAVARSTGWRVGTLVPGADQVAAMLRGCLPGPSLITVSCPHLPTLVPFAWGGGIGACTGAIGCEGWACRLYLEDGVMHAEGSDGAEGVKVLSTALGLELGTYRVPEVFIPPRGASKSEDIDQWLLQSLLAVTIDGDRRGRISSGDTEVSDAAHEVTEVTPDLPELPPLPELPRGTPSAVLAILESGENGVLREVRQPAIAEVAPVQPDVAEFALDRYVPEPEPEPAAVVAPMPVAVAPVPVAVAPRELEGLRAIVRGLVGAARADSNGNVLDTMGEIDDGTLAATATVAHSSLDEVSRLLEFGQLRSWCHVTDRAGVFVLQTGASGFVVVEAGVKAADRTMTDLAVFLGEDGS